MTIYDLILIFTLVLACLCLWQHLDVSRLARLAANRACSSHQLLLLDQSVILSGMAIRKSKRRLFAIERRYRFEFSTVGDVRYPGELTFVGKKLVGVNLQAYKMGL